jgi:hypothetical protein
MWYNVIETKVKEVWMAPDWQYSSGCVEEIVKAFQLNLHIVKPSGEEMSLNSAIEQIEDAIEHIKTRGHECERLESGLLTLKNL